MNKIPILIAAMLMLLFTACKQNYIDGEGEISEQQRSVPSFTAIDISVPMQAKINIQEGAEPSVTIKGYANLMEHIETSVDGNTLKIKTREGSVISTDKDIMLEVTVSVLSGIDISGSGDVVVVGTLSGNEVTTEIAGSGSMSIDSILAESFNSEISGSGELSIKGGRVGMAKFEIAGSGSVNAINLVCKVVDAEISGSGDIEIHATEKLNAEIAGSGGVTYKGSPAVTSDIAGSGELNSVK